MNKWFYTRLAVSNIWKNKKTYFPYIIASICIVAMFYNIHFLSVDEAVKIIADSAKISEILTLATVVVGIFSVIFLFYTNSFLIKRRKKELGLLNVLGMEKRHIARLLTIETIIISFGSIVLGIVTGIISSKLMQLLLFKLLKFTAPLGFGVYSSSIIITFILFSAIFSLILLWNLGQIQLSNPIELLQGGNVGEREPKTKWIIAIVGVVTLGAGYFIALTTKSPLSAIPIFFVAVILVIIGTYCMFIAGSIVLLKALRKNKNYYYKSNHFYGVSSMIYRMKQNAAGLATICILSVGVLVMISTTVSLYVGGEDVIHTRFPKDISVEIYPQMAEITPQINELVESELTKAKIKPQNKESFILGQFAAVLENGSFRAGSIKRDGYTQSNVYAMIAVTVDEYKRLTGENVELNQHEILYYNPHDKTKNEAISIFGVEFKIKEHLTKSPLPDTVRMDIVNNCYVVTDSMDTIISLIPRSKPIGSDECGTLCYQYSFNTENVDRDKEIKFVNELNSKLENVKNEIGFDFYVDSVETARDSFFFLYGGLMFLGIFLGALFIMATVLIIYYKQITEGYDDRGRFQIMQHVGMDKEEIKRTIKSQVLLVFMLPICVAAVHLAVVFPVLTKLLSVLNLTNVPLFAVCTIITVVLFFVLYAVVYVLTAREYYKIVEQ